MSSAECAANAASRLLAFVFLASCAAPGGAGLAGGGSGTGGQVRPEQLLDSIKAAQARYVKRSTGTMDYQCFTEKDYDEFKRDRTAEKAAAEFRESTMFPKLVSAIRKLQDARREELLATARDTAHPTFATVGGVPTDGSAQTDAGRNAELDIAREMVQAVEGAIKSGGH